jgi:dTDP-glucose 4,6-dehydratase
VSERVLITGASGFVGSHVLRYLRRTTGWSFTCLCSWAHAGNPLRLADLAADERVDVVTHDLRGPLPELGIFDYVLHLAAESHVDRSIADPVHFIENNVASTLNVLEYARAHPPRALILFSTDEVYGPNSTGVEWSPIVPSNPYAASKAAAEAIAVSYWRTYRVPLVITNTNNIVGPGQHGEKFVPRILAALAEDRPLTVHKHGDRIGRRYYNPVANVAAALRFILGYADLLPDLPGGDRPWRFNLPGGEERTNLELAVEIAAILGLHLTVDFQEVGSLRPGYDGQYGHADGTLTDLGFRPVVTLSEGLRDLVIADWPALAR